MEPMTEEIMTTYPKQPCLCGRGVRVHPETGAPRKHRIGKKHPASVVGPMPKNKRRQTWCPEVA